MQTTSEQGEGPREGRRQRRGCKGPLAVVGSTLLLLLTIAVTVVIYWTGTENFAEYIRTKIEANLEAKTGRDVTIGRVEISRGRESVVTLHDVTMSNAPEGAAPNLIEVERVVIRGGIGSFLTRSIRVGNVEIINPKMWLEILPEGSSATTNFPSWKRSEPRRFQIYRLDVDQLDIRNGSFFFRDHRRDIDLDVERIAGLVLPTIREGLYRGTLKSGDATIRLPDAEAIEGVFSGTFRYEPGRLALEGMKLAGRGIDLNFSGQVDPLQEGVFRFDLATRAELARIAEVFRLNGPLEGLVSLDGQMRGDKDSFQLTGDFTVPSLAALEYDLSDVAGSVNWTKSGVEIDIERAGYGGGVVTGEYRLTSFQAPLPMSVDLQFSRVAFEKLFEDWTLSGIGLRGAVTGNLQHSWNGSEILAGEGSGRAELAPGAQAFGKAPYPLPVRGAVAFALRDGRVVFERGQLSTPQTNFTIAGSIAFENLVSDLNIVARSTDLSELDRIGVNFARAADQNEYELLGLGGAGTVTARIRGPLGQPRVEATIEGTSLRYSEQLLGDGSVGIAWDGPRETLTLRDGEFRDGDSVVTLAGTIRFPSRGPGPQFDLAVGGTALSVQRALDIAGLDFEIPGVATGPLRVTGTPDAGTVHFDGVTLALNGGSADVTGTVSWMPGEGNVGFDLVIDARNFPTEEAVKIAGLELGIGGLATGRMRIEGRAAAGTVYFEPLRVLEGASRIDLDGSVAWAPGEGNLVFDLGLDAENVTMERVAAFLDLGDLPVEGTLSGRVRLQGPRDTLSGAGTARLTDGSIAGERIDSVVADLLFTRGVVEFRNVELSLPAGTLRGSGRYDLASERFDYIVEQARLELAKLDALGALGARIGGTLVLNSSGVGTLAQPEIVLEARLEDPLFLGMNVPEGAADPHLYLSIRNGVINLKGQAFDLITIDGSGTVSESGDIDGQAEARVGDLSELIAIVAPGADIRADGEMSLAIDLGGNIRSLETIEATALVSDVELELAGRQVRAVEPIRLSLTAGRVNIDSLLLQTDEAQLAVTGGFEIAGERRIDVEVRGRFDAALAQIVANELRPRGWVDVQLGVGGTLAQPLVRGTAEIRGGELRLPGINQVLSGINATLLFQGEELRIDSLRGRLGGGDVVAGGTIGIGPAGPTSFRVSASGSGVSIRLLDGLSTAGDFDLLLSGDPERSLLQGRVVVDRAVYSADFDVTSLILNRLLERRAAVPDFAASWQDRIDLRIDVAATEGLAIRNNVADIEGSGELSIRGTLGQPVILGTVEIAEGGTLELQDVEYEIVSGNIIFQNPFRIDPYLDITAEGRIQEYDLTINLTGTLDRINTTITSDPPAGDLTLLSLLTANVGPSSDPRSLGITGQSFLLQSVGGLIGSRICPFVDAFRIDASSIESSDPTVTFEKQISSDVRVIVSYNLGNGRNVEIVEWQVTPDWVLLITSENEGGASSDGNVSSELAADARFRRRYEGHWWSRRDREIAREAARARAIESGAITAVALAEEERDEPPVPGELDGPIVTAVTFTADTEFDTSRLAGLVTVQQGQPLSSRDVRDSIRTLFATGEFRDIRVDASPAATGGTVVTFRLTVHYRYGELAFEGARDEDFGTELRIRSGDVVSLNAIDRSAVAIQERLRRRGFLEATVDTDVQFEREESRADVTFIVEQGPQARVAAIQFEGDTGPVDRARLLDAMRTSLGDEYRLTRARDEIERIQRVYVREGFRRATVRLDDTPYDPETNGVTLVYSIDPGLPVEVLVEGIEQRTVRKWLPFRGRNDVYTPDAVSDAAERIERELQRRGYFYATVNVTETEENDAWIVRYEVDARDRYTLAGVVFEGNESFSDSRLEDVVGTARPGFFRRLIATVTRRELGVTQEQLSDDRDAVETFYRIEGFSQATVDRPIARPVAEGELEIVFPIQEGPRAIVTGRLVEGNEQIESGDLPSLAIREGDPFNPLLIAEDITRLRTFYADRGHVEADVSPVVEFSEARDGVEVTYRIVEGPEVRIGEVIVRGNDFTTTNTIERTANLETGEPFTFSGLLSSQRNLQRLGIFGRVELLPDRAGTDPTKRNIVIEVEEGRNLTLSGALGYSSEDGERATLSASHRNLFGTGRYLGIETRISRRQRNYFLNYRSPFLFQYDYPTQISFFKVDEERNEFGIEKIGTFVEVSRVYRESLRASLRYEYRRVEVQCLSGATVCGAGGAIPDPDLPIEDAPIEISSIGPTVVFDKRDDPFNPRDGHFFTGSLEYAFPLLAAESEFLKGFVQGAWYFPFSERSLLAVSGRAGAVSPLGDSRDIPYPERFFAGGSVTHRGVPIDLLGNLRPCGLVASEPGCSRGVILANEDGDLVSLGGEALAIVSAEYRYPLFGALGGALFVDAGNVWARLENADLGDLRYAAGLGLRYLTPVGPVRLDVGFNLDRQTTVTPAGESVEEEPYVIFFTLGYPF